MRTRSKRDLRGWTFPGAVTLLVVAIAATLPSGATDYYVRTDGSDANPGTGNTPSAAWRTVGKCFREAGPGDRCLVQPGRYYEWNIEQVNGGRLVTDAADVDGDGNADTCTCEKGSTTVTCSATVSRVHAGQFIRCAGSGPHFAWTEVVAVSGTTLELAEPYRGQTSRDDRLQVADFVQFLGQGDSPADVRITSWKDQPASVEWHEADGVSCVWWYDTAQVSDDAWGSPHGFREKDDAHWNLFSDNPNGSDTYVYLEPGGCPCAESTVERQVAHVPGSWGRSGTRIYLRPRSCRSPAGLPMQASPTSSYRSIIRAEKPYTVLDGFLANIGGEDTASATAMVQGFTVGASHSRYSNLRVETGRFYFSVQAGEEEILFEHIDALGGARVGALRDDDPGYSGLRFYDVEIRGGHPNQFSTDRMGGRSESDRVIIERMYMHRAFNHYWNSACGQFDLWSCTDDDWAPGRKYHGEHGFYNGSAARDRLIDHLLIQNSIIEITLDGFAVFNGKGGTDVIFRNNTFGFSGEEGNAEMAIFGNNVGGSWGAKLYNNVFVCDGPSCRGSIRYYGNANGIVSDYNAFLYYNYSGGGPRIWGDGETLDVVIDRYGQEKHSFVVCKAGCAGTGTYYNDGKSGLVDVRADDGDPTDYTPLADFRGIDRGLQDQCPAEDFFGNPRSDGKCDIGAIEYGASVPDTTPPAPVSEFMAEGRDGAVDLSWKQSSSSDNRGTVVRFRTDTYPTGPSDGSLVCDVTGSPGEASSCVHDSLANGTTYYYSAFSYDTSRNYGEARHATATPEAPANEPPSQVNGLHRTDTH